MKAAVLYRPFFLVGLVLLALAALWWGFRAGPQPLHPGVPPSPPPPGAGVPPPGESPPTLLVDDFEIGQTQGLFGQRKNRLDAFQGTWARRPSYTVITKVLDTRPGSVGNALRLEFCKVGGWCGWYTLLNGIDVSKHNALTFWVKGEQGGERFDIGFADDTMQDLEIDAVYAGPVTAFIPGVTTEWQQVKVPLQGLRSDLNLARMGSLVLWFRYEGKGAIQIDDVAFAYDEEVEKLQRENTPRAKADPRAPRAMWIWKTDPIAKPEVRKKLFEFSERTAIRIFYLYLGEEPVTQTALAYQQELREFLKEAHAKGIEVHALQGNPLWALKAYHPIVLAWIGGWLEFNQGRPLEERMDGVHMDIEPYLTQEWETGDREKLKAEFLELLDACRKRIDKEKGDQPFLMGLAIPLFYSREPEMEEKLLKYLDYAALMDYYDSAADIIAQGKPHLALAGQSKVEMMIGVETQDLVEMKQGKRRNTFIEEGWQEMERELEKVVEAFKDSPSFGGLAVHYYDSYRLMQKGRNVPIRERSSKVPPVQASHNPKPVTIDGDLSEWADAAWSLVNQKEQVIYGAGAWNWDKDLSFKYAVRWEKEALLVAVDATDNAVVQEKKGADMWEGDHLELWIDADLEADYNEAVNSDDDFQIGVSPGNFKGLPPEVTVWVPSVKPDSVKQIELGVKQKADGYTMEVRLPTSFLFQNIVKKVGVEPGGKPVSKRITAEQMALQSGVLQSGNLKAGFRLGMMMDLSDCDAANQPQKSMMSTSPDRQWGDPTTFNILELKE